MTRLDQARGSVAGALLAAAAALAGCGDARAPVPAPTGATSDPVDELLRDPEFRSLALQKHSATLEARSLLAARMVNALDTVTSVHGLVNAADARVRGGSTTAAIVSGLRRSGAEIEWAEGSSDLVYLGLHFRVVPDAENEGRDGPQWRCYAWPPEGSDAGVAFVAGANGVVYGTDQSPYHGPVAPRAAAALDAEGRLAPSGNAPWTGRDGALWRPAPAILDDLQGALVRLRAGGLDAEILRELAQAAVRGDGSD